MEASTGASDTPPTGIVPAGAPRPAGVGAPPATGDGRPPRRPRKVRADKGAPKQPKAKPFKGVVAFVFAEPPDEPTEGVAYFLNPIVLLSTTRAAACKEIENLAKTSELPLQGRKALLVNIIDRFTITVEPPKEPKIVLKRG